MVLLIKQIRNINNMQLSNKTVYGIRAMLDLALAVNQESVKVAGIARRQGIPQPYLGHLMRTLISGGLVQSVRGPAGGVSLLKPPDKIAMSEVYRVLEGSPDSVVGFDAADVGEAGVSLVTQQLWQEMRAALDEVLESTTLADMVTRYRRQQQSRAAMYHI
jgi:Rrf2 family protein